MEVRLQAPWHKSAAWARLRPDGSLELELYDYSSEAERHMGGDVAWIYTVAATDKPLLLKALGAVDDAALLQVLGSGRFTHIHAIRDWMRSAGIPFLEKFDGQA